jgi:FkbM family methyltransferase
MLAAVRHSVRNTLHKVDLDLLNLRRDEDTSRFLPYHLGRQMKHQRINCVVDVGANRGQFAHKLLSIGYAGRILSVEPIPELCETMRREAGTIPQWRIVNAALGEREETRDLNVLAANDLSSLLPPRTDIGERVPGSEITSTIRVSVTTLDTLMSEILEGVREPRIFLKLDTQGYDLHVLRGARNFLRHVYLMQSEISIIPLYEGMPNFVESLGTFRDLAFIPTGFFAVSNHISGVTLEYDVVLVPMA